MDFIQSDGKNGATNLPIDIDMHEQKSSLRQKLKTIREKSFKNKGMQASLQLQDQFMSFFIFESSKVISAYYPIQSELNVLPLVEVLRAKGHRLSLPRIQEDGLDFAEWKDDFPLLEGSFGTKTLPFILPSLVPQICLVPLLGFDRLGHRLGYGQGHYDRALEKLRKIEDIQVVGIGFSDQEVSQMIHEPHDQLLDYMVTEKEVISFIKT